jgi:hypothetical protein
MTKKHSSTGSNPTCQSLLGCAAIKAGTDNNDSRMVSAGERALRMARKAMREGKAGKIEDGKGGFVIVEK